MAISGDYPRPIQVNGFTCRNCQDVSLAKQFIDPEHPASSLYGISAESDPTRATQPGSAARADDANAGRPKPPGLGVLVDVLA